MATKMIRRFLFRVFGICFHKWSLWRWQVISSNDDGFISLSTSSCQHCGKLRSFKTFYPQINRPD